MYVCPVRRRLRRLNVCAMFAIGLQHQTRRAVVHGSTSNEIHAKNFGMRTHINGPMMGEEGFVRYCRSRSMQHCRVHVQIAYEDIQAGEMLAYM